MQAAMRAGQQGTCLSKEMDEEAQPILPLGSF